MARAYYRQVFHKKKKFSAVPDKYKEAVRVLLEQDVADGLLTEAEYNELILTDKSIFNNKTAAKLIKTRLKITITVVKILSANTFLDEVISGFFL